MNFWLIGFAAIFGLRMAVESVIKPSDAEPRPMRRGRLSLILLSVPFLVSGAAVGYLLYRDGSANPVLYGAGVALFCTGFAGRVAALRVMGRSYSLYLDPAPTAGLRTAGIYGRVRHPIYACYLLETGALALVRPNAVSLAALLVVAAASFWRIRAEERLLLARYGAQYREYMNRTCRLVPGIY